jgi:hypothetical protein
MMASMPAAMHRQQLFNFPTTDGASKFSFVVLKMMKKSNAFQKPRFRKKLKGVGPAPF